MKNLFVRVLAVVALTVTAAMQTTAQESFAYQAVIRDGEGNLITNSEVELKFSLLNGGKTQYAETQKAKANQYGNISVMIGAGEKTEGDFAKVPWNTLDITLKVEVKPAGSDKFIELGQTKINPVPYAMYAPAVGKAVGVGSAAKGAETLFEVNDREGRPVFAVTNDGIVVYVDDQDDSKIRRSGFLIVGRDATKGESEKEYFSVTADGTQINVDDEGSDKIRRSGFLITGRDATKDGQADYMKVDGTGTTVYVDGQDDSKIRRSGFLITGRDATKGVDANLFAADAGGTTVYVDDAEGDKIRRSGFLITGRDATKADRDQYMAVTSEKVNFSTTAFTVTERNEELGTVQSLISVNTSNDGQTQVVVHTDIAMEDEVIEVTDAPMQGEYAMAVTDSMWFTPAKEDDYRFSPEYNQLMTIYGEGEYAPAVSVKFEYGNNSIVLPSLFFDGEGNPTSSAKKAAVVVFDTPDDGYGEGVYIIRAFEPIANKTIEFGLMNTDGEFVKITATINSAEGKPFQLPVGDYEGGKIISEGDNYYGAPIMLKAISDKGKIFAGWTMNVPMQLPDNVGTQNVKIYVSECPLNGMALIDEWMFGGDETDLTPEFANPELYVSNSNSENYHSGFSNEDPLKTIDLAVSKIAQLAFEQPANGKLDWTIKVVDNVYGAQTIPAEINIPNQPNQPDNILKIQLEDVVNSIRLTSISGDAQIDGSWWYSEGDWYYGAATGSTPDPVSALNILSPVPVTIDNLTVKRGHAALGGGIFIDENANITLADGVNITGNDAQEYGGGLYVNGNACVTIADGVKIVGNTARENGGGVYVSEGAKLYMTGGIINSNKANNGSGGGIYATENSLVVIGGSAVIGDTEITDASEINDDNCANQATMGGGIYSLGNLYIGYKLEDDATEFSAENLVEDENSTVTIQGNYANTTSNLGGGGVYVGGKFDMASGLISGNQANNGGGVMATATGEAEFTMTGGEIAGNSAAKGSGVYVGTCTFTMSGAARVNAGNDVYLASRQKITIGGAFSGSDIVATITPTNYNTALEHPVLGGESELVESLCGRFAVTPGRTQSGGDLKYWRVGSDGKVQEMIGTKAVPDAVGDIVFTDGSAVPYSEDLTLTQGQKNSAVAVIFDAENKKGVALNQRADRTTWCKNNGLEGYEKVQGACSEDNGKANTEAIYNLGDFDFGSDNYPPFEYAKGYTAGGYTDWYIPAANELSVLRNNCEIVNSAIGKVGGTLVVSDIRPYWSSTQSVNAAKAWALSFDGRNITTDYDKAHDQSCLLIRCVRQFSGNDNSSKLTTYYVAPNATNGGIGSDDNNGLNGNAPFATIGKAISMMTEAKNYLVVICGEVKGNQTIQNAIPDGSTLTIMGNRGNNADTLNAENNGTSLTINTSVPVFIENLRITGGSNSGIRILNSNAIVTLGLGVIVGDDDYYTPIRNNAGEEGKGGGVYMVGGTLTMRSGCKVCRNTATMGGGIYLDNDARLVMKGGEVSSNTVSTIDNTVITLGGGIYIAEGATFDMKGGKFEYNDASDLGQSVYVGGTFNMSGGEIGYNANGEKSSVYVEKNAQFNIKGTAKISGDDVVFLDSENGEYATINIVGALEGENSVALIKPSTYDDNIPLLTTSVDGYLPIERFSIAVGEGNFGTITSEGKLQIDFTKGKATMKSLEGKFTVDGNGKKVQFSSGNLNYYRAQPKRWEFAAHQYDAIQDGNIVDYGQSFNTYIDLFCYGTSGYNNKTPDLNASSSSSYYNSDLTDTDYDWGVKITKDYKTKEQWRTLTESEWNYLLKRRTNAAQLYGLGRVNNIQGLILLPDDWSSDGMPAFTSGDLDYENNNCNNRYDSEQWSQMEAKGAVFLPATGYRYGANTNLAVGNFYQGYYWSASAGKCLFFDGQSESPQSSARKCGTANGTIANGYAVRLVHDYEKDYSEIFDFSTDGTTATITQYKGSEEDVTIPETVKIDGTVYTVTAVGEEAFMSKGYIQSVTIPATIVSFGGKAFYNCSNLKTVHYQGTLSQWCGITFGNEYASPCSNKGVFIVGGEEVTELVIPDGVTSIPAYAFSYCQNLKSVSFPSTLTTIGSKAFYMCETISAVFIPNTVTNIGTYIFYGCHTNIFCEVTSALEGWASDWKYFLNNAYWGKNGIMEYNYSITDATNHTAEYGPYFGTAETVSVPQTITIEGEEYTVTSIASSTFMGNKNIEQVIFPEGITKIPSETFRECSNLKSFNIPASVTKIEGYAFYGCPSLETVTVAENGNFVANDGTIYSKDGKSLVLYYTRSAVREFTIPSSVDSICACAFCDAKITKVIFNDNLKYIGQSSFRSCNSLSGTLTIPDGVTVIEYDAFAYCGYSAIHLPANLTALESGIINGSMTSVSIPSSVTRIGTNAFWNCSGISTIELPSGLTEIESWAFGGTKLTSLSIPDGVTHIGTNILSGYSTDNLPNMTFDTESKWYSDSGLNYEIDKETYTTTEGNFDVQKFFQINADTEFYKAGD